MGVDCLSLETSPVRVSVFQLGSTKSAFRKPLVFVQTLSRTTSVSRELLLCLLRLYTFHNYLQWGET